MNDLTPLSSGSMDLGSLSEALPLVHSLQDTVEKLKLRIRNIGNQLHDANNMLMSLSLFSMYANRFMESKQYDQAEKNVRLIQSTLASIQNFQRQALNYLSGEGSGLLIHSHVISDLISEFLSLVEPTFRDRLKFELDLRFEGQHNTDRNTFIYHILLNIIKNAYEALGQNQTGTVYISTFPFKEYVKHCSPKLLGDKQDHEFVLVIGDSAGGLSPEAEQNLFNPFFSRGKAHGTGLGTCAIRQGVEEWLKGAIAIDNRRGEGLFYHIWLPSLPETPVKTGG